MINRLFLDISIYRFRVFHARFHINLWTGTGVGEILSIASAGHRNDDLIASPCLVPDGKPLVWPRLDRVRGPSVVGLVGG